MARIDKWDDDKWDDDKWDVTQDDKSTMTMVRQNNDDGSSKWRLRI